MNELKLGVSAMEKTYRTLTYGELPLKLDSGRGWIFPKGIEVKAHIDFDTGEVTFFIDQQDLAKLKQDWSKPSAKWTRVHQLAVFNDLEFSLIGA